MARRPDTAAGDPEVRARAACGGATEANLKLKGDDQKLKLADRQRRSPASRIRSRACGRVELRPGRPGLRAFEVGEDDQSGNRVAVAIEAIQDGVDAGALVSRSALCSRPRAVAAPIPPRPGASASGIRIRTEAPVQPPA
jgi:hypothetical protein